MTVSPCYKKLYRTRWTRVICAAAILGALAVPRFVQGQYEQREQHAQADKGPRALGLVELSANGKAHLIPIAIMYNGDFFDAGAYKAAPVPMALYSGTVYEAERSGVSQGLFTVVGALETNGTFIGQGRWQNAASVAAAAAAAAKKKQIVSEPRGMEDTSGPPRLHRRQSQTTPSSTPSSAPAPSPSAPSTPDSSGDDRPTLKRPPSEAPAPEKPTAPEKSPAQASASESATPLPGEAADENDPNRPRLRREKPVNLPSETPGEEESVLKKAASVESPASAKAANVHLIPAISDAGGPQPESYVYAMKPEEEQQFRKKMLALAAQGVNDYVKKWASGGQSSALNTKSASHSRTKSRKVAARAAQPNFSNTQLTVFDLSASNEPVLILTATAQMPHQTAAQAKEDLGPQYSVTLVASQDIYGDLHIIRMNVTDKNHLDVAPRMELIDAVDADGDRRGELLFRETSDQGSGFAIYRVIGYQLYPLFQSTPGEE